MKATLVRVTKLVIGSVDLGHGVVGVLFNDRIAARHIRVVLARKTPPRRLDGVGGRVERQFQYGEGVSRHPISLPGRRVGPQNNVVCHVCREWCEVCEAPLPAERPESCS